MTLDCVDVYIGLGDFADLSDVEKAVRDTLNGMELGLREEEIDLVRNPGAGEEPPHVRCQYRFPGQQGVQETVIGPLRNHLDRAGVAWARLEFHECHHDDEGDCQVTFSRTIGDPPGGI